MIDFLKSLVESNDYLILDLSHMFLELFYDQINPSPIETNNSDRNNSRKQTSKGGRRV
jgi:hypothetical protein